MQTLFLAVMSLANGWGILTLLRISQNSALCFYSSLIWSQISLSDCLWFLSDFALYNVGFFLIVLKKLYNLKVPMSKHWFPVTHASLWWLLAKHAILKSKPSSCDVCCVWMLLYKWAFPSSMHMCLCTYIWIHTQFTFWLQGNLCII